MKIFLLFSLICLLRNGHEDPKLSTFSLLGPLHYPWVLRVVFKGLFTWMWGTPGRLGNPLWWGNPPVHIISHFNLITFAWWVGWPASPDKAVARSARPGYSLSRGQILPYKRFKVGNPPSRGRICDTSNSRKNHFSGGFASLLKVTIESHSTEGCSKSSKWVLKSINRQNTWFSSIFLVYVLSGHPIILRKCNPGWRGCKIACRGGKFFYPTYAGYLTHLGSPTSM